MHANKTLAILGASGHGKVLADIAELNHWKVIFFDDAWPKKKKIENWNIVGNTETLITKEINFDACIVGIGNNAIRLNKQTLLVDNNIPITTLIHPSAIISKYVKIGQGSVVMAKAVINPFAQIGETCIINTAATIDHDCQLANGVHISPGVHLAGGVTIGESSWVGIGANIIQLVDIGERVIVGAGATVIKSIPSFQKVAGTPAKVI